MNLFYMAARPEREKIMETTEKTIKELAIDCITTNTHHLFLHNTIAETLKKFEGKQITKRFATAVKKAMPDYTVYFENKYSLIQLVIWKGNYNDRTQHVLGYASNPIYHTGQHDIQHSGFEYYNYCYGFRARERIAKCEKILQDGTLVKLTECVDAIKSANDAFKKYDSDTIPFFYAIKKTFDIKS